MENLSNIYRIENRHQPHKGCLLISEPLIGDDYFSKSVILLTEFSKERGAVGFVLNKKSSYKLSDLVDDIEADFEVYSGGIVETNTLHYIHKIGDLKGTMPLNEDLFWGGDFEDLKTKIRLGLVSESDIWFFLGYAGWAPEQLEQELKEHSWAICPQKEAEEMIRDKVFDWKGVVNKMGDAFKHWQNVPDNPTLN